MVTDTIADLVIRIKNAGMVRKERVSMPYSKMRNSIAQKLRATRYIADAEAVGHGTGKKLSVKLAYDEEGRHRVSGVKRISKPGCRIYAGTRDIQPIKNGNGIMLLSTSKGVLTGEEARRERVGGEVLFAIW